MLIKTPNTLRIKLYSDKIIQQIENSLDFKRNNTAVNDIIRYKNYIKDRLLNNLDLLYALNNVSIEKYTKQSQTALLDNNDMFWNTNIYPYMRVPDPQADAKSYVLYDVNEQKYASDDSTRITKIATFRIVVHEDVINTDFGICRTDLIGMLITSMFDGISALGTVWEKTSDLSKTSTNDFYYREITYKASSTNCIPNRLRNGLERIR